MTLDIGRKLNENEYSDIFKHPEGSVNLYYGRIRSGKTYGATADIMELLKKGYTVYATWPIKVEDFDDRTSPFLLLFNLFFFRKRFYRVLCTENLHYIDAERGECDGIKCWNPEKPAEYIEYLNKLNHCILFIDEAWRVIDSYTGTNFTMNARNLILVTGHKFRTVNLIAQRPTSIHVTARGNVNRFYRFEKLFSWPFVMFLRKEYQDMEKETVDEDKEPISVKRYVGRRKIYNAYNSYYYGELKPLHDSKYEVWELDILQKLSAIVALFRHKKVIHRLSTVLPLEKIAKKQ